jgi:Tol biopolymer transport system component
MRRVAICIPVVASFLPAALAQQPSVKEMPQEMVWVSRQGDVLGRAGVVQNSIFFPELSPDEKSIAVSSRNGEVNDRDVWIHDIAARTKRRITRVRGNDNFPLWTPDGRSIIFTSSRIPRYDLFRVKLHPLEPPVRILQADGTSEYPRDISPDGKTLVYTRREPDGRTLWVLKMEGDVYTNAPFIPKKSGVWADGGKFSPDGKHFAYSSNEEGPWEVYVCETANPAKKWKVSAELRSGWAGGGGQPRWRGDGKEIFYIMGQDTLASVPVDTEGEFSAGEAKKLFSFSSMRGNFQDEAPWLHKYDVTADGQRFLFVRLVGQ